MIKSKIIDLITFACILFLSFSVYYSFEIPGSSHNNQYINIIIYIIICLLLYYIALGFGKTSYLSFWKYQHKKEIYFFAGDTGSAGKESNLSYYQLGNKHLIASGMGNKLADHFIIVSMDTNSKVHFELVSLNTFFTTGMGKLEDYKVVLPYKNE